MFLTVEIDLGIDIKEAGEKALALGKKLDLHVKFKFNDVDCTIYSNRDDIEGFEESYLFAMKLPVKESIKWAHN